MAKALLFIKRVIALWLLILGLVIVVATISVMLDGDADWHRVGAVYFMLIPALFLAKLT